MINEKTLPDHLDIFIKMAMKDNEKPSYKVTYQLPNYAVKDKAINTQLLMEFITQLSANGCMVLDIS